MAAHFVKFRRVATTATILIILAVVAVFPAHADSWIGDSLELTVADADLVVRATLETSELTPSTPERRGIFRVKDTLKGNAGQTVECLISQDDERNVENWQRGKTDLLVCLVKSERYREIGSKEPMAAEWSVRHGRGGETGIIPLDGNPGRRAPTADFVFLIKPDDILKCTAQAIRANADTMVAREPEGTVAMLTLGVPFGSPVDKELHSGSGNSLAVPINEMIEPKAKQWIKTDNAELRENGVEVLAHFKSDDNIAALKGLLTDPEVRHSIQGANTISEYPVRAAALVALTHWGVDAHAVVKPGEWRVIYGSVFIGLLAVAGLVYLATRKRGRGPAWGSAGERHTQG
jgi:hypothetical protein